MHALACCDHVHSIQPKLQRQRLGTCQGGCTNTNTRQLSWYINPTDLSKKSNLCNFSFFTQAEDKELTMTMSWGGRVIHNPRFAPNAYCKVQNHVRAVQNQDSKGDSLSKACTSMASTITLQSIALLLCCCDEQLLIGCPPAPVHDSDPGAWSQCDACLPSACSRTLPLKHIRCAD